MSPGATFINPPSFGAGDTPISQAAKVGNLLLLAGQVALDGSSQVIAPGEVEPQTRAALERVQTVVREAGGELTDVVSATVYLARREDVAAYNKVWVEVFGDHRPARATLQAGLMREGLVVEIVAIAVLPD